MKIRIVILLIPFVLWSTAGNALCIKDDLASGATIPGCALGEICLDGPSTKNINGLNVTRDCWDCQAQFTCNAASVTPEPYCAELVAAGCSPTGQVCSATDGTCTQSYSCLVDPGTSTAIADCGTQSFSLDSYNYDTSYPPNTDFAVVAANMGVIEDAVKDMDVSSTSCTWDANIGDYVCSGPVTIFEGRPLTCVKKVLGFSDCCKDTGWGLDLSLGACLPGEVELGYAKEGGMVHKIGRYCNDRSLFGTCVSYKHVYCAFRSMLGRIVQEQGRAQLGIGWGTTATPNCRGLSVTELQAIDFALIDFTEYFSTAMADIVGGPSAADMGAAINNYVTTITGTGCSQFDPNC